MKLLTKKLHPCKFLSLECSTAFPYFLQLLWITKYVRMCKIQFLNTTHFILIKFQLEKKQSLP